MLASAPPAVIIDEAVAIAKKYSTEESGPFVNGILDRVMKTHTAGCLASAADPATNGDPTDER